MSANHGGSTGERNTLLFLKGWSVADVAAEADLLLGDPVGRNLASVAGGRPLCTRNQASAERDNPDVSVGEPRPALMVGVELCVFSNIERWPVAAIASLLLLVQ
jgi:hypothetical protein